VDEGQWHFDAQPAPLRFHRHWLLLGKEEGMLAANRSNLIVTPSTALTALLEAALRMRERSGEGEAEAEDGAPPAADGGGGPDRDCSQTPLLLADGGALNLDGSHVPSGDALQLEVLEAISCTPALRPGDAVFWLEDVMHRSQDLLAERVALLLEVHPGRS